MVTTPQTNTSLAGIAEVVHSAKSFVLCGHRSPDGDCIGSQLTLYHALRALGKKVTCLLVPGYSIDSALLFLSGASDMVPADEFEDQAEVFIACDVPTLDRMGGAAKVHEACQTTITIDHHATEVPMSDYTYVDPDSASTSMIAWELVKVLGVTPTQEIAECAFTGLMTDTGAFQFQNSDAAAFAAAAEMVAVGARPSEVSREVFQSRRLPSLRLEELILQRMEFLADGQGVISYLTKEDFVQAGAVKADAEPLINLLRSVEGVRVASILREEEGSVRGSFRSKDSTNVAILAQKFNGGGHKAAAGFTIYAPIEEAVKQISEELSSLLESLPISN